MGFERRYLPLKRATGGGGGGALGDLSDVTLTSPSTNEVLQFTGTAWVNAALPTIPTTLGSLTDVTITATDVGDLIRWDGAAWVDYPDSNFAAASHTHLLSAGATDVTATASELNLLDLSGLTAGWALIADTATTASWQAITESHISDLGNYLSTSTASGTPTAGTAWTVVAQKADASEFGAGIFEVTVATDGTGTTDDSQALVALISRTQEDSHIDSEWLVQYTSIPYGSTAGITGGRVAYDATTDTARFEVETDVGAAAPTMYVSVRNLLAPALSTTPYTPWVATFSASPGTNISFTRDFTLHRDKWGIQNYRTELFFGGAPNAGTLEIENFSGTAHFFARRISGSQSTPSSQLDLQYTGGIVRVGTGSGFGIVELGSQSGDVGLRFGSGGTVGDIRWESGTTRAGRIGFPATDRFQFLSEAHGGVFEFAGENDAGTQVEMLYLDPQNTNVDVKAGNTFRVQDSTNADWVALSHDGTNGTVTANQGNLQLNAALGAVVIGESAEQLWLRSGSTMTIYSAANTANVQIGHDGTDLNVTGSNAAHFDLHGGMGLRIYDTLNTDSVAFDHDGTDLNTTFTTTTDWNVYGITGAFKFKNASQNDLFLIDIANTLIDIHDGYTLRIRNSADVDYLDIYETGTACIFDANVNPIQFQLPTSSSFTVAEGGTAKFQVDMSGNLVRVRDGYALCIADSADTDYMDLSHDGTDLNSDFTNTLDWNLNDGVLLKIFDSTNSDVLRLQNNGSNGFISVFSSGGSYKTLILGGNATGYPQFPNHNTTASAANAFINSSSGQLLRSTSSQRYKRDIRDMTPAEYRRILDLRPVRYRSLSDADDPEWSWYGLIAEEVALVDPRMVQMEHPAKFIEDENGAQERVPDKTQPKQPESVSYERLTVQLLGLIKEHEQRLAALELPDTAVTPPTP